MTTPETTTYTPVPVIGYIISTGNLRDGFFLNGFFETEESAMKYGNTDPHLDDSWCVVPVYALES